jgi:hypothetical protein
LAMYNFDKKHLIEIPTNTTRRYNNE